MKSSIKKIIFALIFAVVGFGLMQVPFSQLVGASKVKFSLFDFYGPIAGAFIGSIWGLITVGVMQLANWGLNGFALDTGTLIRLLPVLFALLYFAKNTKWILAVPVIAMIAFWAHPEGRQAWYYALYWTIPLIAHFFRDRWIFARALGATFTQHSVGGALWIWAFNMKAALWIGLIPIVWKERALMALGITVTYIAINYLLSYAIKKIHLELPFLKIDSKHSVEQKINS